MSIDHITKCRGDGCIVREKCYRYTVRDSYYQRFFVIIRVLNKYFKTKVDAKSIGDAEQIIEKTIAGLEYQIMNIYKANE